MITKRLIGVVTVKDGWAVQSFGYRRYLPIGRPEVAVDNLDRWGADEIFLQCIDRGAEGPDFALLERVSRLGPATPLIYGGGVRTAEHAVRAVAAGADRICVDALLHDDPLSVSALAEPLGAQAVVGVLPLSLEAGRLQWLDYRSRELKQLSPAVLDLIERKVISEVLVVDWRNEGTPRAFDQRLLEAFAPTGISRIAFGGLSEATQIREVLDRSDTVAVAIGNFLNYREHALQALKEGLVGIALRPACYASARLD
jgi:imidazole glycerol-phosphate synthase subunit HisF